MTVLATEILLNRSNPVKLAEFSLYGKISIIHQWKVCMLYSSWCHYKCGRKLSPIPDPTIALKSIFRIPLPPPNDNETMGDSKD